MPKKMIKDELNTMLRIANLSPKTNYINELTFLCNEEFETTYQAIILEGVDVSSVTKMTFFKKIVISLYLKRINRKLLEYVQETAHREDDKLIPYNMQFEIKHVESKKIGVFLHVYFH